ncbi:MAG: putative bifunctional diguanylate cyclase/phosphodiesterase [Flavobacteriaceae bacterium]
MPVYRKLARLLGEGEENPELNRARFQALSRQIPLMYLIIVTSMAAVSYTHYGVAPLYLTGIVPLVLTAAAGWRSLYLLRIRVDRLSDRSVRKKLGAVTVNSTLIGAVLAAWVGALFPYGDPYAQGHAIFFLCLTGIVCVTCIMYLRLASTMMAAAVVVPAVCYLALSDVAVFRAVALNMALVTGAMLFITFRHSRNFNELIENERKQAEQGRRMEQLNAENMKLANLDSLTGLPNRRSFFAELEERIGACEGTGKPLVVGILDLDGFKPINDVFGHIAGDKLLVQTGQRLSDLMPDNVMLARLGGDEFGLILREPGSEEDLIEFGTRICKVLEVPFQMKEGTARVAATLGFAAYPAAGDTAEILFERADYALCYAKQNSKGTVCLFSNEHETIIREVSTIAHRLREADLDEELSVVYQPIIDAHTGRIMAFEALARWHSPVLGTISPNVFIRSAEQAGMIGRLTSILLAKALRAAQSWPETIGLSFNLSTFDLCSPDYMVRLVTGVERSGVPAKRITFEITESAVLQDFDRATDSLNLIRDMGATIALDDFGTGFSSLSHVQQLPVDRIKIDRTFTHKLTTDKATRDIVRTIVDLCRNLDLKCVVEGVETQEQLDLLKAMGCSLIQGFLFSRPVEEAETAALLRERNPQDMRELNVA